MIIFVLINLLPCLIDLHCCVQVLELMHIDILFLPFLWNTIPFNIVIIVLPMVHLNLKLKLFFI